MKLKVSAIKQKTVKCQTKFIYHKMKKLNEHPPSTVKIPFIFNHGWYYSTCQVLNWLAVCPKMYFIMLQLVNKLLNRLESIYFWPAVTLWITQLTSACLVHVCFLYPRLIKHSVFMLRIWVRVVFCWRSLPLKREFFLPTVAGATHTGLFDHWINSIEAKHTCPLFKIIYNNCKVVIILRDLGKNFFTSVSLQSKQEKKRRNLKREIFVTE